MNVKGIKHAGDWPFPIPGFFADEIEDLIRAMETDSKFLDCYQDNVEGGARCLSEEQDRQISDYYLRGGWHADVAG